VRWFEIDQGSVFSAMRGARSLSNILSELITARGCTQSWSRQILEHAWNKAIGEPYCYQTQVGELRRGVLNVTVAHPSLLEELAAFRKSALLIFLQSSALGVAIHDIQFRVGSVVVDIKETTESSQAIEVRREMR
jgi:Dna[CI] antecedent, DciA